MRHSNARLRKAGLSTCHGRGFRQGLAWAATLMLMAGLGPAVACRAEGLIIEAPVLTATPGSSGSFDVLLADTNPAGGASYDVATDSFQLQLSGPLDASFTDVSINTVVPYIYVTSGTTQGGGPLSSDTFPNTLFTASDSEFASPGFRTVNPGDVFGLAHVSYSVSSTTSNGIDTISFPNVSLTDINGNPLLVVTSDGLILVGVPEPLALIQGATAATIGLGAFWWRRRGRGALAR